MGGGTGRRRSDPSPPSGAAEGATLPVPGEDVGGLEVLRFLGEGGMGHLLLARDRALGRDVAIKFLRGDLRGDPRSVRRFRREGKALAAVDHPHVVRVYAVGSWRGWPFLAMEHVRGTPLAERIRRGPLPPGEGLRLAGELASALAEVHGRRISHRDVNPRNVLLREGSGAACLIDFGLSRAMDSTTLSTGGAVGTPLYMAPEQIAGRRQDLRVDVYSFGATLFEALAGRPPHEEREPAALFHAVLHEDAPPLRSLRPEVPRALEVLVARCLARAPEFRPRDGEALLAEVRAAAAAAGGEEGRGVPAGAAGPAGPAGPAGLPRSPPRDPSEPLPLLGRSEAFAAIAGALEGAEAGRGSVLLVEGEGGAGKSRLLREAARAARARAIAVLPCDGGDSLGAPFAALRRALLVRAREVGAEGERAVLALVRHAAPGNAVHGEALRWFLGGAGPGPPGPPSRSDLREAVAALLRSLLRERPALLAVDDAHALDEGSLDLLARAAEEAASWPAVLLFAYRPPRAARARAAFGAVLPRLRAAPGARAVPLGPLSEAAAANLVHLALRVGEEEACRIAPALQKRTGGNPLFLVECLRLLEEEGSVREDPTGRRLRQRITQLALPPRLREVALRRILGLPAGDREVLGAMSVDAAGLPPAVLARCLDVPERAVLRSLQHLVVEKGLAARTERGFAIPHAEIREAAYADLLPEVREAYHGEAAAWLEGAGAAAGEAEPARLAFHLRASGRADRAIPLLVAAGRRLLDAHAPGEALPLLDEALACSGGAGCFEAAFHRTRCLEAMGDIESAGREMRRLVETTAGEERFRATLLLARHERDRGRIRESWGLVREAEPLARTPEQRLRAAIDRAVAASRLGMEGESLQALGAAEEIPTEGVPRDLLLQVGNTRGSVLWRSGRVEEAKAAWEAALAIAEGLGDQGTAVMLLANLGLACAGLGLEEEGIRRTQAALERSTLLGALRPRVHALLQLADLCTGALRFAEAEESLEAAERELGRLESAEVRYLHAARRAELGLARGAPGEALRWARAGRALASGVPHHEAGFLLYEAEALLLGDDPEAALAAAREAAPALAGRGDAEDLQRALAVAVQALLRLGRAGDEMRALGGTKEWRSAEAAAVAARLAGDPAAGAGLEAAARALSRNRRQREAVDRILAGGPAPGGVRP